MTWNETAPSTVTTTTVYIITYMRTAVACGERIVAMANSKGIMNVHRGDSICARMRMVAAMLRPMP